MIESKVEEKSNESLVLKDSILKIIKIEEH